jgi:hypothetical protein
VIIFEDAEKFCTDDEAFVVVIRVRRKIEDRSGASLSVALLFFLVCAIVGSVLIAAASVSVGRMKGIEQGEQERYAVDSAMELIAEEMGGGEVTFTASMPSSIDVMREIDEDEDGADNSGDELNDNGYIKGTLGSKQDFNDKWKLKNISKKTSSEEEAVTNELEAFRDDLAQKIFEHYLEKQSENLISDTNSETKEDGKTEDSSSTNGTTILGIWNPSDDDWNKLNSELEDEDDEDDTDNLYDFFTEEPNIHWEDINKSEYQYISVTPGLGRETPYVLKVYRKDDSSVKDDLSVNVLFSMDSQFNISAIIYPYEDSSRNHAEFPDRLADAKVYRVIRIRCEHSPISFKSGETYDVATETTSVQHSATITIKWGKADKSSVISKESNESEKYPDFFPEQFKNLIPEETDGSTS